MTLLLTLLSTVALAALIVAGGSCLLAGISAVIDPQEWQS